MNKTWILMMLLGFTTGYFISNEVTKYYEVQEIKNQIETFNECIQKGNITACDVHLE